MIVGGHTDMVLRRDKSYAEFIAEHLDQIDLNAIRELRKVVEENWQKCGHTEVIFKKESPRIFSVCDPYGEEDWNN